MKTRKRFLSIVLMLAMLVSMFTVMASAETLEDTTNDTTVTVVVGGNGKVKVGDEKKTGTFTVSTNNVELTAVPDGENYTAAWYYGLPGTSFYREYSAEATINTIPDMANDKDLLKLYAVFTETQTPQPTTTYDVTVYINGNGKVMDGNKEIKDGGKVTLTADATKQLTTVVSAGTTVCWNLNDTQISYDNSFTLKNITADGKLYVTFVSMDPIPDPSDTQHTLTVETNRTSRGYIKCGSDKEYSITKKLVKNEKCTFEAVAKSGYEFSYWKSNDITIDDADMYDDELTITMPDKNATVTAVFVEKSSSSHSHSYVENYNDTYHWKECKYCGAVKSGSKEKHDLYSYKKNGYTYKYCLDCDYDSYTYDYDKHPSSHDSYVYTDLNASYHLKECAKKGCSYEVKEYHTWIKNPDRKTRDSYPYVCKYCDRLSKTAYNDLPFRDVDDNVWYYDDVLYAYINGYMDGLSAGQFAPNQNTTRAQIVTILWRLTGEPRATKSNKFNDVSSSAYYDKAVSWAVEAGVVNGFDAKTFKPNDYVTREQLAAILYRYAEYMNVSTRGASNLTKYDDYYQIGTWARDAMAWANYHGLINGVSYTRIDPKGNATRAQVAAILHRFAVEFGNY